MNELSEYVNNFRTKWIDIEKRLSREKRLRTENFINTILKDIKTSWHKFEEEMIKYGRNSFMLSYTNNDFDVYMIKSYLREYGFNVYEEYSPDGKTIGLEFQIII